MLSYNHREGITPQGKEVRRMYEVTTATKTLWTTSDKLSALCVGQALASQYKYVEVKRVISTKPYRSESIRIFSK